jgi:hypothetical protein
LGNAANTAQLIKEKSNTDSGVIVKEFDYRNELSKSSDFVDVVSI